MSCGFSRETLALYIEGDLADAAAATTVRHLGRCEECRRFLEELRASQGLVKSARCETINRSDCAAMRRDVMAMINERPDALGWRLRIERAITLGLKPSYGMAAVLLLGIVSASVLAHMDPLAHLGRSTALDMPRPAAYRDWILVSAVAADADSGGSRPGDRVYINPSSYREYAKNGRFPNGTILVWEAASPDRREAREGPHAGSATLLVSVKDSTRFEGGWAFFDFSSTDGAPRPTARALPASRGCGSCHRQSASNDYVFTQLEAGRVSLHVGWSRAILTT